MVTLVTAELAHSWPDRVRQIGEEADRACSFTCRGDLFALPLFCE
jgi:hypothetical protein